jgi:hypothetical protein
MQNQTYLFPDYCGFRSKSFPYLFLTFNTAYYCHYRSNIYKKDLISKQMNLDGHVFKLAGYPAI